MGTIEDFKFTMADDHGYTFAEANEIMTLIVDMQKELNYKVARQTIVNHLAKTIRENPEGAVKLFHNTVERKEELKAAIQKARDARWQRGFNRNLNELAKWARRMS